MSKELIIDLDGHYLNFVAIKNAKVIKIMFHKINKDLTKYLVEYLDWFLKSAKINLISLNKIYFVNGPGSFTNIRLSTLLVKTLSTLHQNIKIYDADRFHFYANYQKNEFLYIDGSSTTKYVYIHAKDEDVIESQLVSNEKFDELKNLYFNYDVTNISDFNVYKNKNISNISSLNLNIFKDNTNNVIANYMKEPNIDKKVLK